MEKFTKNIGFLLLFALVAAGSCKSGKENQAAPGETEAAKAETSGLLNTRWELVNLKGEELTVEEDAYAAPFVRLGMEEGGNKAVGYLGCNKFFASFTYDNEGGLSFGTVGATKRLCDDMEIEKGFSDVLSKCASYKLQGSQLTIFDAKGRELAVFEE